MRSTSWWRSLAPFERAALASWAAAASAAALLTPEALPTEVTLCLFRTLTGLRCPGCGMGHAVLEALRGHLASSWSWHPFGALLALAWTAWALHGLLNLLRGRSFSLGVPRPGPALGWGLAAAVLCAHALRVL